MYPYLTLSVKIKSLQERTLHTGIEIRILQTLLRNDSLHKLLFICAIIN